MGQRVVGLAVAFALVAPASVVATAGADVRSAQQRVTTEALVTTLARSGVGVYDEASDAKPISKVRGTPSPLKLTRWQVQNMATELEAGGGVLGRDLDGIAPLSIQSPPTSYLLAGYVKSVKTPGAQASRGLMGKQDWKHAPTVAFPMAVLTLFVADLAQPGASATSGSTAGVHGASALVAGGPGRSVRAGPLGACKVIADFTSGVMSAVFDALTFESANPSIFKTIWNAAVALVFAIGGGVLATLTDPFVKPIKTAVGIVAAVDMATSLFQNWTIPITADPATNRFAVGAEADQAGTFRAKVKTGIGGQWPPELQDCANLVNLTLPPPRSTGAPGFWTLTGAGAGLATPTVGVTSIDAQERSKFDYVTGRETDEQSTHGEKFTDSLVARLVVQRIDGPKFRAMLEETLLGLVPGFVAPVVNPALTAAVQPILERITTMADVVGHGTAQITHHGPAIPIDPCLVGSWVSDQLSLPITFVTGGEQAIMTIERSGLFSIDYNSTAAIMIDLGIGNPVLGTARGIATGTFAADDGTAHTTSVDASGVVVNGNFMGFAINPSSAALFSGGINGSYTCSETELQISSEGPITSHWQRSGVPDVIYTQQQVAP